MAQPSNNGWFFVALGISVIAIFSALAEVSHEIGPASIPIWGIAMGGLWMISRSPIGQAIGHRISGHRHDSPEIMEVPAELYGELDELRARVAELEERTDFAERLLVSRNAETPDAS